MPLTCDANGNLTKDEQGQTYTYDAWNRLVQVKNSGSTVIAQYAYDGMGRRIQETHSGTVNDLYYSAAWQVLEERTGGVSTATEKKRGRESFHICGIVKDSRPLFFPDLSASGGSGTPLDTISSPSTTESWSPDALGNFSSITTNTTTQTRTHNQQNEITSITGATTPTYDANGNLTKDEQGQTYMYDAWNRLVQVKNSGSTVIASYSYDGLGRRIQETHSGTVNDLYYSSAWQVIEERTGGVSTATVQYVWSPVYVDALVLRDRSTLNNGTLDERLWVQQDANWNVTALVNSSGTVVERYIYDPYGQVTVLNASWTVLGGSAYGWVYGFQGLRLDTATGNDDGRERPYRPTMGRFLQNDPLGIGGGDTNFYRVEANNSIEALDPSGLYGIFFEGTAMQGKNSYLAYIYERYYDAKVAGTQKDYYNVPLVYKGNLVRSPGKVIGIGLTAVGDIWSRMSFNPTKGVYSSAVVISAGMNATKELCEVDVNDIKDVEAAVEQAKQLYKARLAIDLFGWSRGALLANEVAHRLKGAGPNGEDIPVRFLGLIDPVGTGFKNYHTSVPDNVQSAYIAEKDYGPNTPSANSTLDNGLFKTVSLTFDDKNKTKGKKEYFKINHENTASQGDTTATEMWKSLGRSAFDAGCTIESDTRRAGVRWFFGKENEP